MSIERFGNAYTPTCDICGEELPDVCAECRGAKRGGQTMNADEVVSALRCCNRSKGHRCSECPVFSRYEHRICKATVDRFAADLIESLQAEITQLKDELADYNCDTKIGCKLIEEVKAERDAAVAENERLAKHGGKYIQLSDERYKMYEKAVKRAEDAEIKLAESQRRERATEVSFEPTALERLQRDYNDLRNYACNLCGRYKYEHTGACKSCKWRKKAEGEQ